MAGPQVGYKKSSPQTAAAKKLGSTLLKARRHHFLSLCSVSEALSVDRSFVSRTESGDRVPDLFELKALAGVLKLDVNDLLSQVITDLKDAPR